MTLDKNTASRAGTPQVVQQILGWIHSQGSHLRLQGPWLGFRLRQPPGRSVSVPAPPSTFDWSFSRTRPSRPSNEEACVSAPPSLPAAWAEVPANRGWRRWLRAPEGCCGSGLRERSGGGADCAAVRWCKASCNPRAMTRPRSGGWPTSLSSRTQSPFSMVRLGDLAASLSCPRL